MTRTDAALLAASVREPEAFGEVFDRHVRVVHAYLARRLGDDRADDAAAETFRIAFERRASFDAERGEVPPCCSASQRTSYDVMAATRSADCGRSVASRPTARRPNPACERRPLSVWRSQRWSPATVTWSCSWRGKT